MWVALAVVIVGLAGCGGGGQSPAEVDNTPTEWRGAVVTGERPRSAVPILERAYVMALAQAGPGPNPTGWTIVLLPGLVHGCAPLAEAGGCFRAEQQRIELTRQAGDARILSLPLLASDRRRARARLPDAADEALKVRLPARLGLLALGLAAYSLAAFCTGYQVGVESVGAPWSSGLVVGVIGAHIGMAVLATVLIAAWLEPRA